jgi:hypothetical protein
MGVSACWMAGGLTALLVAPVAAHGLLYVRAVVRKRRAHDSCSVEGNDQDGLSAVRAVQLVVTESLLWWHAVLTAVRWPGTNVAGPVSRVPVMVLPPPLLPRASVRLLVARLRRDGFRVVSPRLVTVARSRAARVRGFDRALRAIWDETGTRVVDVIAPAGTAATAAAHLASGGSGVPVIRRLLTVGAAGADDPVIPAPTEVIAFYSTDDPLLGRLDSVRRPGAFHVAIRGLGRLGLLHAPYAYTLIREHLLAPLARPSSWTSAAS